MVASASMVISERQYGMPFHYLLHQLVYFVFGLIAAGFVLHIDTNLWQRTSVFWLLLSVAMLVLVLIPGIGRQVNGSIRWLHFGPITLQPSELAKFSVILYMAGYLVRHDEEVKTRVTGFLKPMILLGFVGILLLMEPDFGATTVIVGTALAMMFLAGVRLWQFIILFSCVGAALGGLVLASPYRLARLTGFLHPWADAFDSGYQLTQSLIAFGRGGVFGVGLGNSIQKLFYLPEAHTDFLFAVLGEELGLIGGLIVVLLFGIITWRAILIGRRAHEQGELFAAYLAYGLGMWLALQAMINIGVNTGVLPTKGITLPLMSYGGSSMMIMCVVVALLLRIASDTFLVPVRRPGKRSSI